MNNINKKQYFDFRFTEDGSVGLYNNEIEDVYHSKFGAKTEGWEKFVAPLNFEKVFHNKKEIKVLDICYGIGYNTKALLKKIIQTNFKGSVEIDALEYDKNLVLISPFIKDGYLKHYPQISYMLLNQIYSSKIMDNDEIYKILENKRNNKYFEHAYKQLIKNKLLHRYSYNPSVNKKSFVHNIYYHCISRRIKKPVKSFKFNKIKFKAYFDDARRTIMNLNAQYDIIFLDAFTPSKLPTLWSLDFFMELRRLSHEKTILLTYSNSASVRHAMIDAGFYVGKLYDKQNRHCGTIATCNKDYIEHHLNDFDIGLLYTNAGVYYRDEKLNKTRDEIILEFNNRKQKLNLESSSHYIKYNKNKEENVNENI